MMNSIFCKLVNFHKFGHITLKKYDFQIHNVPILTFP